MSNLHYLALSRVPGIGGATARKLIERFGDIESAFAADESELAAVPRVTPDIARSIISAPLDALESELESLDDQGVSVLTWDDDDYPANLRSAPDSPYLLYAYGSLLPEDGRAVAVVGSRDASEQGIDNAQRIARGLAEQGVTIVSGLALGIDAAAHRGALNARAGRTLGVLGSGLRMIHPRSNAALAHEVAENGAILTEYHPDTPVSGPFLMARDRIVSGLSLAVIVVEAGLRSGSVDTAEKARRQNRLVFAVPGTPGCDALISSGAVPLDPGDIDSVLPRLDDLGPEKPEEQLGLW
jgi:DNA processing protein